jgi:hypothetical protein
VSLYWASQLSRYAVCHICHYAECRCAECRVANGGSGKLWTRNSPPR